MIVNDIQAAQLSKITGEVIVGLKQLQPSGKGIFFNAENPLQKLNFH